MQIPKTFLPGKKLEKKVEELKSSDPYKPTSLAIALTYVYGEGWDTDILIWNPSMGEPARIATRHSYVEALCVYNNLLYEAGYSRHVVDTLHNRTVAERNHTITSLCAHNGIMYDGGLEKIYETDKGKIISEREGWVKALCSFNNELYDSGSYKKIFKTFTNELIGERKEWVYSLCPHDNTLYDSALDHKIRNTFRNKVVARRKDIPFTLFSLNDKLYDAGMYYNIYETLRFFKKKFLEIKQEEKYQYEFYRGITAAQPISSWLAQQLLSKSKP